MENSTDLILIANRELKIEYVSPAVIERLGYSVEELLGKRTDELYHPDCLPYVESVREQAVRGEGVPRFTALVRHQSGSYIWMQGTIRAVLDKNGEVTRMVGVWHDVTEIMTLAERLDQAIQIAGLGHWEWDLVQDRVFWSDKACEICGMDPGTDVTLATVLELLTGEKDLLDNFLVSGCHRGETAVQRPDGTERIVAYQGNVLYDRGKPAKIVGVIQDVTEKRMIERALVESEKLAIAGQLAAGIAHEVRNPLTAIKGLSQLFGEWLPDDKRHLAQVMVGEIDRINSVIGQLLLSTKPHEMTLSTVSLAHSIQDVLRLLTPETHKAGITVNVAIPAQTQVLGDLHQLKQVWMNLLLNAMEAMPGGGQITIAADTCSDRVSVSFRDEGAGISSEHLTQLGQPFYTTKERGTGLGLLVCRNILDNHSGAMEIESEVGQGTTVTVYLPLAALQNSDIA